MDQSAIQEIQKTATALITEQAMHDHDNVVVIPDNHKIQSLEPYLDQPTRFRAKFETRMADQFIDYCNDHADEATEIFIDDKKMTARAIIDLGEPGDPQWGDHSAYLTLDALPAYAAVLVNNERRLNQLDFVDFAEDWPGHVQFFDENGENLPPADAINRIRRLTINSAASVDSNQGDFKSDRSAMETIEVKSGQNQPPAGFVFSCAPYHGFEPRNLHCQIRAITNGKEVLLKYRIIGLENLKELIALEFKNQLIDALDGRTVRIGNLTMD